MSADKIAAMERYLATVGHVVVGEDRYDALVHDAETLRQVKEAAAGIRRLQRTGHGVDAADAIDGLLNVLITSHDPPCSSCGEGDALNECPRSERACGHHCNHSWSHDSCCWCGVEFGEDGVETWPEPEPEHERLRRFLDELERVSGPVSPDLLAEARRAFRDLP